MYDIIVIGAGPAGLTAALYARRAEKSVLIIERSTFGGQMTYSPKIENYPGAGTLSGNELADRIEAVAELLHLGEILRCEVVEPHKDILGIDIAVEHHGRAVIDVGKGAKCEILDYRRYGEDQLFVLSVFAASHAFFSAS